jgi:hypothetical protein
MEFERESVWVEEPVGTRRLPDPVRSAAVRAVLVGALALVSAIVELLLAAGQSWLSAPMMVFTVVAWVVATWAVLDVWITRQVWNQRGGVVSQPSSAARDLRRERRVARRAGRAAARERAAGRRRRHRHIPRPHGV